MLAVLNDQQKDEYVRLKAMGPRETRARRAFDGSAEAEFGLFPSSKRIDQLKLTEEQKKKVGELRQEAVARFRNILTPEQRQRLGEPQPEPGQPRTPAVRPKSAD